MKLFVYGTLRQGGENHQFLQHAQVLADRCWVYGELHDTGFGYPVLKESQQKKIWGELYEVDSQQLVDIDELEEYSSLNESNEYVRVVQQVYIGKQSVDAFVYIAGDQLQGCEKMIESGDWLHYVRDNGKRNG